MNKFIGLGNLTKDPEFKEVKSGKQVCTFSIAINNKVNNTVTYLDVETWNKSAQNCHRFLSKGRKVLIEGRLQLNTWQSQSGESRSKVFCIADLVTFLDRSEAKGEQVAKESKTIQEIEEDEFADIPF